MSPLRRLFLTRSLAVAGGFALIAAVWLILNLAQLQSQHAIKLALPHQQAAQLLSAEIQTLSALFAQMALTRSLAELGTLQDRIEAQWSAVQRTFQRIQDADGSALEMQEQLLLIRRILDVATHTAREHREDRVLSEHELYLEHNQAQALHLATIRLATHASGLASDLNDRVDRQSGRAGQFLMAQVVTSVVILVAVLVTLFWLLRLVEERLIARIERLGMAVSAGQVTDYLDRSLVGGGDEIDVMHQHLHDLLTQIAAQRSVLEKLATTDSLTGLSNRRAILEALQCQLALARRGHPAPAVILLDIDYFKKINDKFGHAVGDLVLQHVSQILRTNVRETDSVGRFGGEEFLVVLPNTDLVGAQILAEKLREGIRGCVVVEGPSQDPVSCTASFGVAAAAGVGEGWDSLIKRADDVLYRAKDFGRDRVEIA